VTIEHRLVDAGRLKLHVAELGSGPPVVLLHGFPSYWADWQEQMRALAAAGFRVFAVDLPGYAQSEQLPQTLDYRSHLLAADLAGLIRALGVGPVDLIGHDWGGGLAFFVASEHPELVRKLVVLNAAHPEVFRDALRHFEQLRRSWYILLFQLPWLPEWLIQRRVVLSAVLRGMAVRAEIFSEEELEHCLAALRTAGAARAAVNYYRAAFRAPSRAKRAVLQPTLLLWGERDPAFSARLLLTDLGAHVPNLRIERFANAGHWPHRDLPELVSQHFIEFLRLK
jgi:pimeloyl-ACP methyl ester carboxylesterase